MIIGIGTDLANIARVEETLETHGDRFKERTFAQEERDYVEKLDPAKRSSGYAKRWAAKEAAAKALGLGIRDGIYMKDIIVTNDAAGRPSLRLEGGAKDRLTAITPAGKTAYIDVSLSDDAGMALAFVIISAH